jgi:hypothetical protein
MRKVIIIGGLLAPLWLYRNFSLHLQHNNHCDQVIIISCHGHTWTKTPWKLQEGETTQDEVKNWKRKSSIKDSALRILSICFDDDKKQEKNEYIVICHSLGCLIGLYIHQILVNHENNDLSLRIQWLMIAPAFSSQLVMPCSFRENICRKLLYYLSDFNLPLFDWHGMFGDAYKSKATDDPHIQQLCLQWKLKCGSFHLNLLSTSIDWFCHNRSKFSWENILVVYCERDQVVRRTQDCQNYIVIDAPHDPFSTEKSIDYERLCNCLFSKEKER